MKLPPLPEPECCTEYGVEYHATQQIIYYGLACAKAALEEAARECESRQTPGTGSVAILNGAIDAIRAIKIEEKG